MKKNIFILGFMLCIFSMSNAQNCNAGARIAERAWTQTGQWTDPISIIPFKTHFSIKKKIWNSLVGNSSATWGPRHIELNKSQQGTVQGGTKRTFVSNPLFYNQARIIVNKTGGRGRTIVLVCTHDDEGNSEGVKEYEFANSGLTPSKTFLIPNVRGKIISVGISCKGAAKSFSYNIKLENID